MLIRTVTALAFALCFHSLTAAAPEEKNAYDAAVRAFEWSHFERAEKEFAQFIANFPDSDLALKAAAFRLRSRAHHLADQSKHGLAAAAFRQLRREFPNSPNYLEFIMLEAWSEYHLGNRETVVNLLGDTKGPFQSAAIIRSLEPAALKFQVSGWLLLAQTYLEQKNYPAARQALAQATNWDLNTEFQWRRQFILTKIHFAANEFEKALAQATPLLELAEATEKKEWIAESAAALGEVRIATNQKEAAIRAYKKNLAEGIPQNRRREAWTKIIQLRQEQSPGPFPFLQSLEQFVAETPNDNALDIPLLALAKLKLQLYYQEKDKINSAKESPTPTAAELLGDALTKLELLLHKFSESPLRGKALYHLGWCYWELQETEKSFSSFYNALNILPEGFEKDIAQFKLADGHYALKRYENALFHYQKIRQRIAAKAEPTHPHKETFLAQVLYQTLRAAIKDGNPDAAADAVSDLIALFPDNLLANKGTFLFGQHLLQIPQSSEARKIFRQLIERFPNFPLKAEVELAIAYSHELDGNWKSAADAYQNWTTTHPHHKKQAQAAYARAWCISQLNQENIAATLFQTFLEKHGKDKSPNNQKLANQARLWLGNHHFNRRNFNTAKQLYTEIFNTQNQQTNLITFRARLMDSRASFRQNQFQETIDQLKTLRNHILKSNLANNYFKTFRAEVQLNLGDAYFEYGKQLPDPDDREKQIRQAQEQYQQIQNIQPNSRLWAIAEGRSADAARFLSNYPQAKQSYQNIINSPPQQADITLRSQAEVALGIILEQEAEQAKTKAEQTSLQKKALHHYHNVIFGTNRKTENFDAFWRLQALRQAVSLTIQLNGANAGIQFYQKAAKDFTQSMPSLQLDWNSLIQTLKTNHKPPTANKTQPANNNKQSIENE